MGKLKVLSSGTDFVMAMEMKQLSDRIWVLIIGIIVAMILTAGMLITGRNKSMAAGKGNLSRNAASEIVVFMKKKVSLHYNTTP